MQEVFELFPEQYTIEAKARVWNIMLLKTKLCTGLEIETFFTNTNEPIETFFTAILDLLIS